MSAYDYDQPLGQSAAELSPMLLSDTPIVTVADGGPYPTHEATPPPYPPSETVLGVDETDRALQYARKLFRNDELSLLSNEGSSAVLLHDNHGRVYKVYRQSERYDYIEDEAAAFEVLGELGVTPALVMLVDAAPAYRSVWPNDARSFGEVQIPRVESTGPFAVLVIDRVEHPVPLQSVEPAVILQEFRRIAGLVSVRHLEFGDVEFVYDTDHDRMVMLDAGGMSLITPDVLASKAAVYEGYRGLDFDTGAELISLVSLASYVIGKFSKLEPYDVEDIRAAWEVDGFNGVCTYLGERITHA